MSGPNIIKIFVVNFSRIMPLISVLKNRKKKNIAGVLQLKSIFTNFISVEIFTPTRDGSENRNTIN